ncbi:MAG TPA: VTT domain-containing protein [Streptosporangiaceae bacterium]|nr:VTT domain-containing protein [Streptosporangiaceae bacterium]
MSVPETESGEAAEPAVADAAAIAGKPDPWNDPRLPWQGKPRTADILCWLGIVLSGVSYWALLPLRVSLIGTHPVVAELLNGSIEAIISAAAFARTGHGTLAVVLLAAIPGLMKFDPLYWWAGGLWGERFLMSLPGSQRVANHMTRVQRSGRKLTWPAVLVSSFLPVPRAVIFVIAGWAGMRIVTFLVLDLIGVLLWAGMLAGLGYALGHSAVVVAQTISRYSWWVTIGLVVLSVLFVVRSQRSMAVAANAAGQGGGMTPES